ncbi:MAG: DUF402 domain-containing protein [Halobacteriaceae archaeon]
MSTAARVRGIYATAITRVLCDGDVSVVQPSPTIRERFDREFDGGASDVAVTHTDDRRGVRVDGDPEARASVQGLLTDLSRDSLGWTADAPVAALYRGRVTGERGGGAILSLGDGREGYLPYDRTDRHVTTGDDLLVQVRDPAAPWADARPTLDTDVSVPGGLLSLERGTDARVVSTGDDATDREVAGLLDLLDAPVPEGWGVRAEAGAVDAPVAALDEALAAARRTATAVDEALSAATADGEPTELAAPLATGWVWLGREARFALDDDRDAVTHTMAGHHRIKAATDRAGEAVDFAEQLGADPDGFPFAAVTGQFGPTAGDAVRIAHGKPDGRLIVLGRGEVTDRDPDTGTVTVRREMSSEGTYDALGTPRRPGDVAVTKFREGRWWAPTAYRSADGDPRGTYCNVSTPLEVFPDAVRYVDLHVDVIRRPDGEVTIVDEGELEAAVEAGDVPDALADRAREIADQVASGLGRTDPADDDS